MKQTNTIQTMLQPMMLAIAMLFVTALPAQAAGLLTPSNGSLSALEIRDHHVTVVIEDGYAVTTVEQVFHNPHPQDLEATYSFPVPEHGAVSEFTMWIDGKPVSGEVLEKQEARRIYEEEKQAGREAGITVKEGYKTFDISVSPVRAGQETRIRLVYLQTAHVDTGIGRYNYPLEEGGVDEEKLAFWTANDKVTGSFSFDLTLRSAYPVDAIRVPNHPQAQVYQGREGEWHVHIGKGGTSLANEEGASFNPQQAGQQAGTVHTLDSDLIVYWRHQPGLPGSVDLVTYKPDASKRGTFMLTVTPGDDLQPITEGSDWLFVLDVSGSMQGKYATLAAGVEKALGKMRPNDRFRLVLFNNTSHELTTGYINATPEMVRHYSDKLTAYHPNGGTNLYAGLQQGLQSLEADRSSAIILVTDGVANVGETEQKRFLELLNTRDVRLFTFIMGNSANRPMLEAMTKHSNGFAVSISNSDDIVGKILEASSKMTHQALHGVELKLDGIKVADMTPQRIGSLYRGQQLIVLGHYWGDGEAQVSLDGKVSGSKKQYQSRFNFPGTSTDHPELERIWAYATIEQMQQQMADFGEEADTKQAITDLALEYNLVTDQTSMVVLREEVFQSRGIKRNNQQRLAVEQQARTQRATQPVQSRRVDNNQPMYSKPRAGHGSGGGAFGWWMLGLLILPLLRRIHGK
jgi:Ca-activated chloride channel family protein